MESGDPAIGKGNWYDSKTRETLHQNLNHPEGVEPHWDYKDTDGNWWRVFEDGQIEAKLLQEMEPFIMEDWRLTNQENYLKG